MGELVESELSSSHADITLAIASTIVEMSRVPMLLLDEGLRVKSVNRVFLRTFRMFYDQVENRSIYDVGDGEWRIPILRHVLEGLLPSEGVVDGFVLNHEFEKLGPRVMRVNVRRLEKIYGESGLIFLSIEDITQKIQADSERFDYIRLLNQMCVIAKIGAWEFDTDNFEGNWTSQVALIHDLNPDQKENVAFSLDLYTEQSRQIIETAIDRAIKEGEPFDLELELMSAAGKRKWVRTVGTPVKRDGIVVQVRGTVQDISEKKQMELAFLESQDKFETIFNTSGALMAICTLSEGRFVDINPSFSQVMGHTREQVIGKTLEELKIFVDSNERPELNRAALREGRARTLMCTVNARDGSPRNLVLSFNQVIIDGVPHCFVVANLILQPQKTGSQ